MTMVAVAPRSPAYRDARAKARAHRRERALERVPDERRVDPAKVRDPLARAAGGRSRSSVATVWIVASMGAHLTVVAAGVLAPSSAARDSRSYEHAVEIVEPPQPPPPPPAETVPPVPPPDRPIEPVKPLVAHAVPPPETPPTPKDEPPPDPTEPPVQTPDPTPARPARRVVGLNLGSTVVGASGPSFAAGNTRMGETSRVAEDPNAVATRPGVQFVPPRRTRDEQPEYPAALRAQAIEGEVGLKVDIDATGQVSGVTVVQPSPHDAFNQAAVASARRGVYAPAVLNGAPVANTIQFTVRFRLKQ